MRALGRRVVAVAVLWAAGLLLPAVAENKLAFVVGIDRYPNLEAGVQLQRAVSDAAAVGDALQSLGFKVSRVTENATLDTILSRFDAFKGSIQPGDTVVFYFAGHGVSLDDGNYLIPADIPSLKSTDERRAKRLAIAEHDFTRDLRNAGARVAIIVIDACRNNPFPAQGHRALGDTERGFKRLELAEGAFSLYSAREGQTALDRLPGNDADPNSVFTRVFLKELRTPGLSLSEIGERVRDEVAGLAQSAGESQVPAVYNDMVGARSVFLNGSGEVVPVPAVAAPPVQPPAPVPLAASNQRVARLEDDRAVLECDRLAGRPADPGLSHDVVGVDFDAIDVTRAVPACRLALDAHPDDPRLILELGRALDKAGNHKSAVDYYRRAADAGYSAGMVGLGYEYQHGEGVAKNYDEAFRLFQKASDAADPMGTGNLGVMYRDGLGVRKNPREAVRLFGQAANAGDPNGMNNLGAMYFDGRGVQKDKKQAIAWYRKAAALGHPQAQRNLRKLHLQW